MIFKILIADDDYINRRLLISLLKKELYQVEILEAIDGKNALNICHENPDIQLVLLDIEMPIMDGVEFLKHYIKDKNLPKIPILAISSNDMRIKEVLDVGADAFLRKPITEEKLLNAIRQSQMA
ncbi:MAG: Response regulator receiver domain protein (CheY-like) [uncultured Sulfurovum sp.]|uniref:Response regulator receiver domain protein (CheY-like) n=1 Tax=uncultured Sulfurovum sp. TaxID=269237 RepID=A0A6S6SMB5_9BACT|nr:MAG: Response regulator receiver domain protein (CheY-like) [uncultured Sulfurovum sp.]